MHGEIYVWQKERLVKIHKGAHEGPIFSMFTCLLDGMIVSGSKGGDGNSCIKMWNSSLSKHKNVPFTFQYDKPLIKAISKHSVRIFDC